MALSQQEFQKLKARLTEQKAKQNEPDLFSRIGEAFSSRVDKAQEAQQKTISGEQSLASGTLQTIGQGAGFVTDIGMETLRSIPGAKTVESAISGVVQKGAETETGQKVVSSLTEWAKQHPEASKNLQSIVDIASLIPVGKVVGTGIGLAEKGAIKTAEKTAEVGLKTAEVGLKTLEKAGQGTSLGGKKLFDTAFDLTADEARLVQANKIRIGFLEKQRGQLVKGSKEYKDLTKQIETTKKSAPVVRADTALEKGIMGTEKQIGTQSGVEKLDLWKNKIEPALKNSKDVITKDELFAKARATVASEVEPTRKTALQNALDALEADYVNFQPTDLLTANKIKTSLDKFTPSKIFKGQEVASELKTLKADMAGAIREKTYNSIKDVNIKKSYNDYGNLKQLEKVGIKALTEGGTKGGFGSFWTTVYDMALTPVKTVGGQVLYRIGNKLEFLGRKGLKNLQQHLDENGINVIVPTK